MGIADYIVVGGGSAGAAVAARLSEDAGVRVLLLEAGGHGRDFIIQLPAGMAKTFGNPRYDWAYPADSDASLLDRPYFFPAGRMLGGGSAINGIVHMRGTRGDLDNWERLGATGWNWDNCLPYFKRSEDYRGEPSQDRGAHGPVTITPMRDVPPAARKFIAACAEYGLPTLADYAGGTMEGAYLTVATQRDGWRCSTEKAYLRPARRRPNLKVVTNAKVERLLFEEGRAVGVECRIGGETKIFRAAAEIVLCAGVFGSPGILMRSGIGNPEDLARAGVELVHALPEVGRNFADHVGASVSKFMKVPTYNSEVGPFDMIRHLMKFVFGRKGALANPATQAMALAKTSPDLDEPDIQMSFTNFAVDIEAGVAVMPKEPAASISTNVARPHSRGSVRIDHDHPSGLRVTTNLLGDRRDVDTLIRGLRLAQTIFATAPLRDIVIADRGPKVPPESDDEWEAFARSAAQSHYHGTGTCRMGSDAGSVVTPDLKVRGIAGLRVADASVMPALVSANTNAAAIMVGERAADIIKGHI